MDLPEAMEEGRDRREEQRPRGSVRVRPCAPGDGVALRRLGHPPGVPELFLPSLARRLGWRLGRVLASGLVAERAERAEIVGSVRFVRDRREPATWIFEHWRVAASCRGTGIGGLLLREGVRLVPGIERLYSYVDWGNEISFRAHLRLGFEASPSFQGWAELGALSTIGPPSPSVSLEPVRGQHQMELFPLYTRAMGSLWLRLLPGLEPRRFLAGCEDAPPLAVWGTRALWGAPVRAWIVRAQGPPTALLLRRGAVVTLFTDPDACNAGLLARVAARMIALGMPRERRIELRGLPRELAARRGLITARILMAMSDVSALSRGPVRAD
jgi:acetyltransferase (GNAT) family protein